MIINRKEFAVMLKRYRKSLDRGNLRDKQYYSFRYLIFFDCATFYCFANSAQDALDYAADYFESKGYTGLFLDDEEEIFEDEYVIAGNFCRKLRMPAAIEEMSV